ncbi:hypothetical protein ULMS_06880 [Patiriisocius marinistellae]|uniref:T9SS type A sorting domain-containing protein n=1 Tax=Patiriisocius marinistellae TaxID=2494560 RepID=A0A5J4FTV8_9FLAO|nr:peptidoglycan DD-metalloendopeptidase family protein [Patiriisocius marinistellae]GEQ85180.1 hypothetical protein ULMS_06880 [Patiriisocius marinistellae]
MKTLLFMSIVLFSALSFSQNKPQKNMMLPTTFKSVSFEKSKCITTVQRQIVRNDIEINKQFILRENPNAFDRKGSHPLFILPLQSKSSFDNYGYYIVNNQVDQNLAFNNNLEDYNCDERTYDWNSGNHEGTDFVLWPYPWKYMQEEVMEIVAASEGIIVDKRDGNFDLNCDNSGNPLWNGIVVEHIDGSQAWYWHFKNGAITNKNIGDTVAQGEYLGAAGSSGSSTVPHLHFEVYDANNNLIDPYTGPCNMLNNDSWWLNQPAYFVPKINHLSTHNTQNFDDDCGVVENTYEELNFIQGETVYFRIFYRDIQTNMNTHITVNNPDGVIVYDYDFVSPWPNLTGAYAEWQYPIDSSFDDGVYTITVMFSGDIYETIFGVNTNLGNDDIETPTFSIVPNPSAQFITVESNVIVQEITIYDVHGKNILCKKPRDINFKLDLSALNDGLYLAQITTETGFKILKRIIKN